MTLDIAMTTAPNVLSAPAQQLVECLTGLMHQRQIVGPYSLVAHLEEPNARIDLDYHDEVYTLYQVDYRVGLLALMELIQAHKISVDEIGERMWRFHYSPAGGCPFCFGRSQTTLLITR